MDSEEINESILNLVSNRLATLCPHCNGAGVTFEACCNVKAKIEITDDPHCSCCCSCGGTGYHLLPKWAVKILMEKEVKG